MAERIVRGVDGTFGLGKNVWRTILKIMEIVVVGANRNYNNREQLSLLSGLKGTKSHETFMSDRTPMSMKMD
jgi:hypothetical protein